MLDGGFSFSRKAEARETSLRRSRVVQLDSLDGAERVL
jgi:hypothetical protein